MYKENHPEGELICYVGYPLIAMLLNIIIAHTVGAFYIIASASEVSETSDLNRACFILVKCSISRRLGLVKKSSSCTI